MDIRQEGSDEMKLNGLISNLEVLRFNDDERDTLTRVVLGMAVEDGSFDNKLMKPIMQTLRQFTNVYVHKSLPELVVMQTKVIEALEDRPTKQPAMSLPVCSNGYSVHSKSKTQAVVWPGIYLLNLGTRIFSKTTIERVVMPIVSDMQADWKSAFDNRQYFAAAFIRVRGYTGLMLAVLLHGLIWVGKKAEPLWGDHSISSEKNNER